MKKQILMFLACISMFAAFSAPFDMNIEVQTSNKTTEIIRQFGDEYFVIYESLDGYTLIKENNLFYYAKNGQSNSLISTGIEIGQLNEYQKKHILTEKHLRDTSLHNQNQIVSRIQTFRNNAEWYKRLKRKTLANIQNSTLLRAPPAYQTVGSYTGLTILVDFPLNSTQTLWSATHSYFTKEICDSYLNGENFTDFGNYSSVRTFYKNISNNKVDYRNIIIGPIMMDHERDYYNDESLDSGEAAKIFINDLFEKLLALSNYETEILPLLQTLSTANGNVKALNILYAGNQPTAWSKGLWPHQWTIRWNNFGFINKNRTEYIYFRDYQMTSIIGEGQTTPKIGTFCHENGHMLCDFPDLYDYRGFSGGVGYFCLMNSGSHSNPPVPVNPYLGELAGWITPIVINGMYDTLTTISLPYDRQTVYKFINEKNTQEYFLIENRQKKDLDRSFPGSGIVIWRCNKSGDNTYPSRISTGSNPDDHYILSYECAVVQADGLYSLEYYYSSGEQGDFWYKGNPSANYKNIFNDFSIPTAYWLDKSKSSLTICDFSDIGDIMTCKIRTNDKLPEFLYTGSEITPLVTVTWKNHLLTNDVHYVLVYSNNVSVGTGYVFINGINNFKGSFNKKFKIVTELSPESSNTLQLKLK